jgi:hypothetical protein
MKITRMFEASDGTVFKETERIKAEEHELMIKLRGLIQTHVRGDSFSPTEIAKIFSQKNESVYEIILKHRRTMGSIKAAETTKKNQFV